MWILEKSRKMLVCRFGRRSGNIMETSAIHIILHILYVSINNTGFYVKVQHVLLSAWNNEL